MTLPVESSYMMFNALHEVGFVAGVTVKGAWEDQKNIYSFIRESLVPANLRIVVPQQVHGADVVIMNDMERTNGFEADGAITKRGDTCLTVTTADCLPMLMADPATGYFAAVHVGWRSFIGGIVENFIQIVHDLNIDPGQAKFFLGPSIGSCCFQVGREVATLFDKRYISNRDDSCYVDLREAVGNKLTSLGVVKSNMGGLFECTSCEVDRYYSFRRDKSSPVQMVSFIYRSAQ